MFNSNTYYGTDGSLSLSDVNGWGDFAKYFGDSGAVGRVVNISLAIATEVKAFHELGLRSPRELRAGNICISGSVERAYINGSLLKVMLGQYAESEESAGFQIPQFNMKMILDNVRPPGDPGNSILTVYGVIFDTWQFNLPEDSFVLEKLTFKARRIGIKDNEVKT
jgi:hypothetical protein